MSVSNGKWTTEQMKSYLNVITGKSNETNDDIEGAECSFSYCDRHIGRWGHNAQPCNDGRCCGECNSKTVIPARLIIQLARLKENIKKGLKELAKQKQEAEDSLIELEKSTLDTILSSLN